jgi:hypothetical protein
MQISARMKPVSCSLQFFCIKVILHMFSIPGCIPCKLYAGDTPTLTICQTHAGDLRTFVHGMHPGQHQAISALTEYIYTRIVRTAGFIAARWPNQYSCTYFASAPG